MIVDIHAHYFPGNPPDRVRQEEPQEPSVIVG